MKKRFQTLLRYRFLLQDLTMRDLKVKYRRSVLGLLWSILNPLLMMVVVTTVFQNVLRVSGSEEIKDFSIFYLTGSLIFNFVSEATTGALNSIVQYSSLIKKVYIPKYIFPIEKCMFAFVNLLFSMIALVIMFVIRQTPIHWTVVLFPIPLIYTFVFSIGLGLILAALNVFFRDVGHLYSVWITAWMYATPIIYDLNQFSNPTLLAILKFNPLYHYITYFREVAVIGRLPGLEMNLICIFSALLFLVIGLIIFRKSQDRFILYI